MTVYGTLSLAEHEYRDSCIDVFPWVEEIDCYGSAVDGGWMTDLDFVYFLRFHEEFLTAASDIFED